MVLAYDAIKNSSVHRKFQCLPGSRGFNFGSLCFCVPLIAMQTIANQDFLQYIDLSIVVYLSIPLLPVTEEMLLDTVFWARSDCFSETHHILIPSLE